MEVEGDPLAESLSYKKNLIFFRRPRRIPTGLAVLLTLLFILLFYFGWRYLSGRMNPYEKYAKEVNALIQKSNDLADEFETLKVDVYSVTKEDLTKQLGKISRESSSLAVKVGEIQEPRGMEKAQAILDLSLELRAKGLAAYEQSIVGAIDQLDITAASQPVSAALRELVFSDRIYAYFKTEAQTVLDQRQIKASFLDSSFLSKENEAEKENVIVYIQQLKGIKVQEPMHGIGIISLATQPRKVRYDEGRGVYVLAKGAMFAATVEVINQGNITETNVPAVAVLKTKNAKEQRREQYILSIKQNERKPVTFQNFLPSTRGVNYLTITIGPLPNEQYTKNNTKEFKFVME